MPNRIRELRERQGLSAAQLAERIGTSQPQISRLEAGERRLTVDWMRRIASALGVKPEDLIAPAPMARFVDDVLLAWPSDPVMLLALSGTHRTVYEVKTDVVSRKGIATGDRIIVDNSPSAAAAPNDGDVVVAEVYDIATPDQPKLVLRQYLAPGLLVANTNTSPLPIIDSERHTVRILGIVMRPANNA